MRLSRINKFQLFDELQELNKTEAISDALLCNISDNIVEFGFIMKIEISFQIHKFESDPRLLLCIFEPNSSLWNVGEGSMVQLGEFSQLFFAGITSDTNGTNSGFSLIEPGSFVQISP